MCEIASPVRSLKIVKDGVRGVYVSESSKESIGAANRRIQVHDHAYLDDSLPSIATVRFTAS